MMLGLIVLFIIISAGSDTKKQRTAIIQMNEQATREKYWGEILERTLSSQNLIQVSSIYLPHYHHMQKYSYQNCLH